MPENETIVKGFFLYFDQCESIFKLPDEQAMGVIRACHDYMLGKEPDLTNPIVSCVFQLVRPTLEKSKKRAVYGKKGGQANSKQSGSKIEANEKQGESKIEANGSYLKTKTQEQDITTLRVVVDSDAAADPQHTTETTENAAPQTNGPPPCPHGKIIDAYHELLPELPQVRSWTNTRSKHLAARWRERFAAGKYATAEEGLAYWRRLFAHIHGNCPWLMGQRTGRNGKAFFADLGWLVMPENFAKVIEGRYVERDAGEA